MYALFERLLRAQTCVHDRMGILALQGGVSPVCTAFAVCPTGCRDSVGFCFLKGVFLKCRSAWIQLPVRDFILQFPGMAALIPPFAYSEPEYVVRFEPISRKLEVGFESDNWVIGG